eukprot:CAMPEP_0183321458 /NCGR_PEP_ID=MMETSP0160_2-20130417/68927_1 /TAXON_ID=2839 ORGANISM="Odontella Sinensis, Strain Grunow 1884" /NCGR_SAMPLE_ID=MMETSP0160_2 /ASSEMBLY_ACC=CAM_ASM_000250 /LENGTH=132 /DNA_ID=CAMNT_0025488401 /DNA_START=54 /DNA_END=452 /DNA_ORIENTATION=+
MGGRAAALSLYRSILRAHADYLPREMRGLGDAYVKSEFRLHRSVKDSRQLQQFYGGWTEYLEGIRQTGRARSAASAGTLDGVRSDANGKDMEEGMKFGKHMPDNEALTEEQEQRLGQLRREAAKADSIETNK